MDGKKQVSIARHGYFYKVFFIKHKNLLDNLIDLSFTTLNNGFRVLNVFYGSYSYWIKEDTKDEYLKLLLREKQDNLRDNVRYHYLRTKVDTKGYKALTFDELCELNKLFSDILQEILELLERFFYRLAPSDMLPNLTEAQQEYERSLVYVIYDTFYESLYNLHAKIDDRLLRFDILEFREIYQIILIFFYGYTYYLQKDTIKKIKDDLKVLFEYYNNKEFLLLYFKYLNGKIDKKEIARIKVFRDDMFNTSLNIFEKINGDLPKSNLMPKKREKILVDDTLI